MSKKEKSEKTSSSTQIKRDSKSFEAIQEAVLIGILNFLGYSIEIKHPERLAEKTVQFLIVKELYFDNEPLGFGNEIDAICSIRYEGEKTEASTVNKVRQTRRHKDINKAALTFNRLLKIVEEHGYSVKKRYTKSSYKTLRMDKITDILLNDMIIIDTQQMSGLGKAINNVIIKTFKKGPYKSTMIEVRNEIIMEILRQIPHFKSYPVNVSKPRQLLEKQNAEMARNEEDEKFAGEDIHNDHHSNDSKETNGKKQSKRNKTTSKKKTHPIGVNTLTAATHLNNNAGLKDIPILPNTSTPNQINTTSTPSKQKKPMENETPNLFKPVQIDLSMLPQQIPYKQNPMGFFEPNMYPMYGHDMNPMNQMFMHPMYHNEMFMNQYPPDFALDRIYDITHERIQPIIPQQQPLFTPTKSQMMNNQSNGFINKSIPQNKPMEMNSTPPQLQQQSMQSNDPKQQTYNLMFKPIHSNPSFP